MLNVILAILAFVGFAAFCVGMYCLFKFYILDRIDALEKRTTMYSTGIHASPFKGYSFNPYNTSENSIMSEIHNLKATTERLDGHIDDIYENIIDPDEENEDPIIKRVQKLEARVIELEKEDENSSGSEQPANEG